MNSLFLITISLSTVLYASSHFECKDQGKVYRPYYLKATKNGEHKDYSKTPKGLLGQNAMPSLDECRKAVQYANNESGVICSRTGLDGWKPTLYTGTVPGRSDFGYLGGSSITRFADCLAATANSSEKGVCYWGGVGWWIAPIDHEGTKGGPYKTIEECVRRTSPAKTPKR